LSVGVCSAEASQPAALARSHLSACESATTGGLAAQPAELAGRSRWTAAARPRWSARGAARRSQVAVRVRRSAAGRVQARGPAEAGPRRGRR